MLNLYKGKISLAASSLLIAGSSVVTLNSFANDVYELKVGELYKLGLDQDAVIKKFKDEKNIQLELWDEMRVTLNEEGKNINFELFDSISDHVDISLAAGSFNKVLP